MPAMCNSALLVKKKKSFCCAQCNCNNFVVLLFGVRANARANDSNLMAAQRRLNQNINVAILWRALKIMQKYILHNAKVYTTICGL